MSFVLEFLWLLVQTINIYFLCTFYLLDFEMDLDIGR